MKTKNHKDKQNIYICEENSPLICCLYLVNRIQNEEITIWMDLNSFYSSIDSYINSRICNAHINNTIVLRYVYHFDTSKVDKSINSVLRA